MLSQLRNRLPIRRLSCLPISSQRGVALLLLVVTLVLGAAAVFYGLSTPAVPEVERDRKTSEALLQAKSALIAYAISVNITPTSGGVRLGDLPCPDSTDSGTANPAGCGNGAGTTGQASRIGRLPWKDLGLPDLRDGDGERLWYAVSNNFKQFTRTACGAATLPATCLNSDTRGTITIRDSSGNIIHNATNTDPANSGVVAVIFAPGTILRRQDGTQQARGCGGDTTCTTTGVCSNAATPKCNSVNYLDIALGEDNANFADVSVAPGTNGFIKGMVRDASGNVIVNDKLVVITYQDIMPLLEKRVMSEVSNCLKSYANANGGRYPWPALVSDVVPPLQNFTNATFGRIPDNQLSRVGTATSTPELLAACASSDVTPPSRCMSASWSNACLLPTSGTTASWWNNWKLHVFYGLADAYKPMISFTQPTPTTVILNPIPASTGCPTCLTVSPNMTADKQFVVILAGKQLSTQLRLTTPDRGNAANYLEGENNNGDSLFSRQTTSPTFNDTVVSFPP